MKSRCTEVRARSVWLCFVCLKWHTRLDYLCVRACPPWVRFLINLVCLVILFDCVAPIVCWNKYKDHKKSWKNETSK